MKIKLPFLIAVVVVAVLSYIIYQNVLLPSNSKKVDLLPTELSTNFNPMVNEVVILIKFDGLSLDDWGLELMWPENYGENVNETMQLNCNSYTATSQTSRDPSVAVDVNEFQDEIDLVDFIGKLGLKEALLVGYCNEESCDRIIGQCKIFYNI